MCHGLVRKNVGKGHWVLLWSLLVECPGAADRDMGASLGALFDVFHFTRLVFLTFMLKLCPAMHGFVKVCIARCVNFVDAVHNLVNSICQGCRAVVSRDLGTGAWRMW